MAKKPRLSGLLDDVAERVAKQADAVIPYEDALLGIHNMRQRGIDTARNLGGIPAPSIAITKPAQGFNEFGDISLIASNHLITPGRKTPVFASDVYSPRFPSLDDDGQRIFRGFTNSGNRRYAPLTLDNVVREMTGPNIRGGESWNYGAGSIRAQVTPQFKSLDEIKAARDKIIPDQAFKPLGDKANDELFALADKFAPYRRRSERFGASDDLSNFLQDFVKEGESAARWSYKDVPPELFDEARAYLAKLRDMPTAYFEAKPQRGVHVSEFAGAVVPENVSADTMRYLQDNMIKRIEAYTPNDPESRKAALAKFKDLAFVGAPAGLLGAGYAMAPSEAEAAPKVPMPRGQGMAIADTAMSAIPEDASRPDNQSTLGKLYDAVTTNPIGTFKAFGSAIGDSVKDYAKSIYNEPSKGIADALELGVTSLGGLAPQAFWMATSPTEANGGEQAILDERIRRIAAQRGLLAD